MSVIILGETDTAGWQKLTSRLGEHVA